MHRLNSFSTSGISSCQTDNSSDLVSELDLEVPVAEENQNNFQKWHSELKYLNNVKTDGCVRYVCKEN